MSPHTTFNTISGNKIKILFFILTAFIGLPVIVFLIIAAKGLIAQASNAKPEDVVAVKITKSAATITWSTSKKTQGVIEYGITPTTLMFYAPEIEAKNEHSIPLTLLTPATTYYFQLNIDGTIFDNDGVPWTFTTKTKDGSDVVEAVKGISTKKFEAPEATKEADIATIGTGNCTYTSCREIQAHLGKGCSASDYFTCITQPTIASSALSSYTITPNPTPTPILIDSEACRLKGLRALNNNCASWEWWSMSVNPKICRDAFDRYILYCRDEEWGSNIETDDFEGTYAISNIDTISKTLPITPNPSKTIYCRLRAVDIDGTDDGEKHATPWINAEKKCE